MGANGSHANGSTQSDAGQRWKTIGTVGEIQIIQLKNKKAPNKLPEESRTPNRIYAVFEKDGSDVKGIAKYGPDGKKLWEIHTTDHDNLGPHYHPWENGHPKKVVDSNGEERNEAHALDSYKKSLLDKVRKYGK